ncbi:uncharacterized protein LOC135498831 [Lineus longissimus]|uniref:uncharacterized protein LOC135498831 n=1 Tax=Lineus longissimus TaxID=88925 RepID=UPI002B4F21DE
MGKGRATTCACVCKIDKGFLTPNGILKIIETVINIICLILTADTKYWSAGCIQGYSFQSIQTATDLQNYINSCNSTREFALATAAIFFVLTLLLFLLFLFCVPDMAGGRKVWNIIDLVHDVIAMIFYLVSFILACVYAYGVGGMIALAIFCLLNLIAYIISLVFAVMDLKGKTVVKVTTT